MIRHATFILPGEPIVVGKTLSELPCGCRVYVGIRADNKEAATCAAACNPAHKQLMERFNLAFSDSLVNPTDRPLIDVVDEILEKVYVEEVKSGV